MILFCRNSSANGVVTCDACSSYVPVVSQLCSSCVPLLGWVFHELCSSFVPFVFLLEAPGEKP